MRAYFLVALLTALVTYLATWGVRWTARRFNIHPAIRERDVHKSPTPRIGGVAMFIGLGAGILAAGFDLELATKIIRMVDAAEYKRRQYPPGTKISKRAFGKDRRLPITSAWREHN